MEEVRGKAGGNSSSPGRRLLGPLHCSGSGRATGGYGRLGSVKLSTRGTWDLENRGEVSVLDDSILGDLMNGDRY